MFGHNNVYNILRIRIFMQNTEGVIRSKERILSSMKIRGPSLPVQVSKDIEMAPLFASAFLSELKAEGKLKISDMKVGSSPLYYLAGQEVMLENFSKYLNNREKEAYDLLREKKILDDEEQEPVVRVALRAIKDFALPVRARVSGEVKTFWKYFSVEDSEVSKLIGGLAKSIAKPNVARPPAQPKVEDVKSKVERKVVESDFSKVVKDYLRGN